MDLYSLVYAVGHASLIICQVMSALTFMATMLVVLSQRAEIPKGDSWMPESLSGRPGDATYPIQL
jgi:hypothetical protein